MSIAYSSDSGHLFRLKADAVPAESGQARGTGGADGPCSVVKWPSGEPSHLTG